MPNVIIEVPNEASDVIGNAQGIFEATGTLSVGSVNSGDSDIQTAIYFPLSTPIPPKYVATNWLLNIYVSQAPNSNLTVETSLIDALNAAVPGSSAAISGATRTTAKSDKVMTGLAVGWHTFDVTDALNEILQDGQVSSLVVLMRDKNRNYVNNNRINMRPWGFGSGFRPYITGTYEAPVITATGAATSPAPSAGGTGTSDAKPYSGVGAASQSPQTASGEAETTNVEYSALSTAVDTVPVVEGDAFTVDTIYSAESTATDTEPVAEGTAEITTVEYTAEGVAGDPVPVVEGIAETTVGDAYKSYLLERVSDGQAHYYPWDNRTDDPRDPELYKVLDASTIAAQRLANPTQGTTLELTDLDGYGDGFVELVATRGFSGRFLRLREADGSYMYLEMAGSDLYLGAENGLGAAPVIAISNMPTTFVLGVKLEATEISFFLDGDLVDVMYAPVPNGLGVKVEAPPANWTYSSLTVYDPTTRFYEALGAALVPKPYGFGIALSEFQAPPAPPPAPVEEFYISLPPLDLTEDRVNVYSDPMRERLSKSVYKALRTMPNTIALRPNAGNLALPQIQKGGILPGKILEDFTAHTLEVFVPGVKFEVTVRDALVDANNFQRTIIRKVD